MTVSAIESLVIKGFLSIQEAEIRFDQLNILIGSNGSGKSNLLRLFELLRALAEGSLQEYVARAGGANTLLHFGRKHTEEIQIRIQFANFPMAIRGYSCRLVPSAGDRLFVADEHIDHGHDDPNLHPHEASTYAESILSHPETAFHHSIGINIAQQLHRCFRTYCVYHFHDTSESARVKQGSYIHDNLALHSDAGNLPAVLLRMRQEHPEHYKHLIEFVRLCAPFFDDFILEPLPRQQVLLRWRERGSEEIFPPDALSDGTLRFICLATLLMQPPEWMPPTILIDEPELGLHPFAVHLIGEAMRQASTHSQIVASTQSPLLLDMFAPSEVIVVDRLEAGSQFRRLNPKALQAWLEEYSVSELWEKNLLGGRPPR